MSDGPQGLGLSGDRGKPGHDTDVRSGVSNQRDRTGEAEARGTEGRVLDVTLDRAASARLDDVQLSVGREGEVARVVQARGDDLWRRLRGSRCGNRERQHGRGRNREWYYASFRTQWIPFMEVEILTTTDSRPPTAGSTAPQHPKPAPRPCQPAARLVGRFLAVRRDEDRRDGLQEGGGVLESRRPDSNRGPLHYE